ncbi:hypothetical protein [Archaeoglobus veneficus]|uniref:Uncharacterized protein n=1 Tax=Archaeoglobus veneficus (strain DSM 11195 / SNP6) TaxID=693661 RepID=F2KSK2_ARCVS|nr:hypothetical protein [Archaeoglobus veneficus]AEA48072.1 hypothetical protein Arcve_2083 [Archaeoglobus veneficus SNP6]
MQGVDLLRLEFDIHHIAVVSRKVPEEHALIRLILSTLATADELQNLVKRDLRLVKRNGLNYYYVKLTSAGKSRISPIDSRTYQVLSEISEDMRGKERIFSYSKEEMDRIVEKHSPSDRKYDVEKLRNAVILILRDCMLFGDEGYIENLIEGVNLDRVTDFLYDFHPIYAGMWDMDDDEVAEDFINTYARLTGISNPRDIAEAIGESVERVERLMKK